MRVLEGSIVLVPEYQEGRCHSCPPTRLDKPQWRAEITTLSMSGMLPQYLMHSFFSYVHPAFVYLRAHKASSSLLDLCSAPCRGLLVKIATIELRARPDCAAVSVQAFSPNYALFKVAGQEGEQQGGDSIALKTA